MQPQCVQQTRTYRLGGGRAYLLGAALLLLSAAAQGQDGTGAGLGARSGPLATLDLGGVRADRADRIAGDLATGARARRLPDRFGHPSLIVEGDPDKLERTLRDLLARRRLEPVDLQRLATTGPAFASGRDPRPPGSDQQTVGPAEQARTLSSLRVAQFADCRDEACRRLMEGRWAGLGPALAGLAAQPSTCDAASDTYSQAALGSSPAAIRRALNLAPQLDRACLMASWDRSTAASGAATFDPRPALAATAVLLVDGKETPFCGGAFLDARRVLTALHCFSPSDTFSALAAGRVTARQASDPNARGWRVKAITLDAGVGGRATFPTAADSIALELEGSGPSVPRVIVRPVTGVAPAFVAGYLNGHDPERRPAGMDDAAWATRPEWWRGLRWARQGSCNFVDPGPDCFRMLCQTVPGFSGSAVFDARGDASGALVLAGIVKGSDGENNVCVKPQLQWATVGVTR